MGSKNREKKMVHIRCGSQIDRKARLTKIHLGLKVNALVVLILVYIQVFLCC